MVKFVALAAVAAIAASVVSATPLEKRQACVSQWGQCGGSSWTGSTSCCTGSCQCQGNPPVYCQCLGTSPTTGPSQPSTTPGCSGKTVTVSVPTTITYVSTVTAPCNSGVPPTSPRTSPTTSPTRPPVTSNVVVTATVSGAVPSPTISPYVAPNLGTNANGNPYYGIPRFVNPNNAANIEAAIQASSDSTFKAKAEKVKQYPTFRWFDTMSSLQTLPSYLAAAEAQAAGSDIIVEIVVYDLPGRDCAADASNGEIMAGGINTYKTQYIDVMTSMLKKKASNVRVIALIEPDSLPNIATNIGTLRCNSTTQSEYPAGVGYAIAELSKIPNTYQYVDAAHSGWLGWPDNQQKIVTIFQDVMKVAKNLNSQATIRGWATNTANYDVFFGNNTCPAKEKCPLTTVDGKQMYDYNPCLDEDLYTKTMASVFSKANLPARFITDTARGGVNGVRYLWGSWCNIKNTGIGPRPATNPSAAVDSFVWSKPPGESDGVSIPGSPRLDKNCDPNNKERGPTGASGENSWANAPQAGQWFQAAFEQLVANANPAL